MQMALSSCLLPLAPCLLRQVEQEKGQDDSVGGIAGDEQAGRQPRSPGIPRAPALPQAQ